MNEVQEAVQNPQLHVESELVNPYIVVQEEAILALISTPILFGVYIALIYLQQKGYLKTWTLNDLSTYLQISKNTISQYLAELEKRKFIRLEAVTGTKWQGAKKRIVLNNITKLTDKQLERLRKTVGAEHQLRVLQELSTQVTGISPEEKKEQELLQQQQQEQMLFDNQVQEKAKELIKKKELQKKKEEQKFPLLDYKSVLDGYRKYKGVFIKPHSPDEGRYRKAAKNMFLSGWSVIDILKCMQFFSEHCKESGYEWMLNWTLETVGKKMGEFKAGTLTLPEIGDELPQLKDVL